MKSVLDSALDFARRGWQVFPVEHKGKRPATLHGLNDATVDAEQIQAWFGNGRLYNIAIRTGGASGFDVLDVDGDEGDKSLQSLIAVYGKLPETPCVQTGGGGRHFFFKHAEGVRNSASVVGNKIDVRGDGGYVVAPPSIHENRQEYRWVTPPTTPLAEWPPWLLARMKAESRKTEPAHTEPAAGTIAAGQRNTELTRLAGAMRRRGFDAVAIEAALQRHNIACCSPPLPADEVRRIAQSVGRYEPATTTGGTLPLIRLSSVKPEPVNWSWSNRFPNKGLNLIAGMGEVGKTTFAAYLMACLTTGRDWFDCENTTAPGTCLFIGDEDDLGCAIRPKLDAAGADVNRIAALDYESFLKTGGSFNLAEHIDRLEKTVETLGDVRAVFFDPLNGYLGRINAYSDSETRGVLIPLQNIAKKYDLAVFGLCHLNKKSDLSAVDRVLGSVAFVNLARSVWFITWDKETDTRYLTKEKSNYSVNPTNLSFRIIDGAVAFLEGTTDKTADDVLQGGIQKADSTNECIEWLKKKLAWNSVLSSEISAEARHCGFSDHALRTAKRTLNVQSKKDGYGGKWMLSLPENPENEDIPL